MKEEIKSYHWARFGTITHRALDFVVFRTYGIAVIGWAKPDPRRHLANFFVKMLRFCSP